MAVFNSQHFEKAHFAGMTSIATVARNTAQTVVVIVSKA